jgi:hypothetical protein
MTTCKIHFVNGKVLEIEGWQKEKMDNNIVCGEDKFGDKYNINLDKVLYVKFEEAE